MNEEVHRLLEAAMRLSAGARREFAKRLLESLGELDAVIDRDVDAAWDLEIGRRDAELDTGCVKTMTWAEARRQILRAP
jgi:hypothetical protein